MSRLRDIMTSEVVTLNPEMTLREAIGILRAENVNGAPVVHGGQVVGVASVSDILDFEVQTPLVPVEYQIQNEWTGSQDETTEMDVPAFFSDTWDGTGVDLASAEWDLLGDHLVGDVMTRGLFALPPDTPLDQAARYMTTRGIHRVLVMEGMRLLGIASASDFVRAVAEHRV
jgi:CBS domain-containing protein